MGSALYRRWEQIPIESTKEYGKIAGRESLVEVEQAQ